MSYPTRRLHRLKTWDYSAPGYYFITICTKDKRCILSDIRTERMLLETRRYIEDNPRQWAEDDLYIHN